MYVGLIIYGRLDTLTGGYIYDKLLVQHLRRQGHHVNIISLPWRHYGLHLLDNFSTQLYSNLLKTPYDLLLQDELNHPSLFRLNRKLRKKAEYPIVTIVHQVLCSQPRGRVQNAVYREIEKRYLKSVDAFIFNSATTRTLVERMIKGNRPSIVACPAGDRLGFLQSAEAIKSRARQKGPLRLLLVGNIVPNKGLYETVECLTRLPAGMWHLTVVGSLSKERKYSRGVERLITHKHLEQQVSLLGVRDGTELAAIISHCHLLVMPFSYEGFGMAYLEAMAFGLPIIASSTGGVKEFVVPGRNGFLIEPGDYASVNAGIKKLYYDRSLLIEMGAAALETFHSRAAWSATLESIHTFLVKLVERP